MTTNTPQLVWRQRYTYEQWSYTKFCDPKKHPTEYLKQVYRDYPGIDLLLGEVNTKFEISSEWLVNENLLEVRIALLVPEELKTFILMKYS